MLRSIASSPMTGRRWLMFFGCVLLSWLGLVGLHIQHLPMLEARATYGAELWRMLCATGAGASSPLILIAMWALMSAAMMAPTLFPALRTFDDFVVGEHAKEREFGLFLAGYLVIWLGFAIGAAALQMLLFRIGWVDPLGSSLFSPLTALLLIGAGLYQFSPLKAACLTQCRAPLMFFMQHWQQGPWAMGLRMGALCVGCCWALMTLAFVGGAMSLLWMGLATLLMILEKLPELGRFITRPLGAVLIGAGLWVIAT